MTNEPSYEEKLRIYNRIQEEIRIRQERAAMPPPPRIILFDSPPDTPMPAKPPPKKKKEPPRAPRKRKSVAPDRYSDDDFESDDFGASQDPEDDDVDVFATKKTARGKRGAFKDAGPDILEANFVGPDNIIPPDEFYSSCDELEKTQSKRVRPESDHGSGIEAGDDSDVVKDVDSSEPRESLHTFCFACEFTNSRNSESVRNSIVKMMEEMYLLDGNGNKVARAVHEYYKCEVYNPMRQEGIEIPMWTSKSILKHMRENLDPRNQIGKLEIERLNKHLMILDSMCYEEVKFGNGTTKLRPVEKTIDLMLKCMKQKESIFKLKFDSLAFYNKESKMNPSAAAALIKEQHHIKIVRKE